MEGFFSPLEVRRHQHKRNPLRLALACAASLAVAPTVHAATSTWDGGGASALWNDLGNWSGAAPNQGNDAFFGTGFASGTDIGINGVGVLYRVNSLTINTITGFTIGRTAFNPNLFLTLESGNLTRQNVSGTEADQFLDIDVFLGANGTWNIAGSNSLIVRGYIVD